MSTRSLNNCCGEWHALQRELPSSEPPSGGYCMSRFLWVYLQGERRDFSLNRRD